MQSRGMSFVEASANIIVGFIVATAANFWVLPLFGFHSTLTNSAEISVVFTVISLVRSYVMRRIFNSMVMQPKAGDDCAVVALGYLIDA